MEDFFTFMIAVFVSAILGISIGRVTTYSIDSDVKLEPKIELVIVDNKVDTLYVYEKQ